MEIIHDKNKNEFRIALNQYSSETGDLFKT